MLLPLAFFLPSPGLLSALPLLGFQRITGLRALRLIEPPAVRGVRSVETVSGSSTLRVQLSAGFVN